MAKKKETAPIEEPKKAQEEKAAESTKTAENEIPESVTLTRDEFLQVKERIDKLEKEKESDVALLQRLQADFDNYRRRNAAIAADSLDEGERNLIKALLPVLDNSSLPGLPLAMLSFSSFAFSAPNRALTAAYSSRSCAGVRF